MSELPSIINTMIFPVFWPAGIAIFFRAYNNVKQIIPPEVQAVEIKYFNFFLNYMTCTICRSICKNY